MKARSKIVWSAAALFVVAGGRGTWLLAANPDLDDMKRLVRRHFRDVAQLSTADLAAWLKDSKREQPVLLDTRTEKEFAVSHLPGAIRVEPSAKADAILLWLPAGKPVVTYCSVGYRSSVVAERLKKAGVASVQNLEGSIFEWANEGRPLEANGKPADKVHPYNRKYGKMLDAKRRAEL